MESSTNLINSKKIAMVVDDDKLAQFFIKQMFEDLGYEVLVAVNGHEAVRHFRGHINVITMDYNMPEMNGIEATKSIRNKESKLEIKNPVLIIGLTAHNDKETIDACFAAGMNKVITKPVAQKELLDILTLQN